MKEKLKCLYIAKTFPIGQIFSVLDWTETYLISNPHLDQSGPRPVIIVTMHLHVMQLYGHEIIRWVDNTQHAVENSRRRISSSIDASVTKCII